MKLKGQNLDQPPALCAGIPNSTARLAALWAGFVFVVMAVGAVPLQAAEASYRVRVVLKSGKELTLDRPWSRVQLDCGDFSLSADANLIESIAPLDSGEFKVTFNDGDRLRVRSLSGNLQYQGEFGSAKVNWSAVREMTTVANPDRRKATGSFSRDHYRCKITLRFRGGATRCVYVSDHDLSFRVRYKEFAARLLPSRSPIQFDWEKRNATAKLPDGTPVVFSLSQEQHKVRANTNLGDIEFQWPSVVESLPESSARSRFRPEFNVTLADGTQMPISQVRHQCSDWQGHRGQCLRMDGHKVEEVFWAKMAQLQMSKEKATEGEIAFDDGKRGVVQADTLTAEWALGTIDIPFSANSFTQIQRLPEQPRGEERKVDPAVPTNAKSKPTHTIRFANGQHWDVVLDSITPLSRSTSPGPPGDVLHFYEVRLPAGIWLCEARSLELTRDGKELRVRAFDQEYAVRGEGRPSSIRFTTASGRYSLPFEDVTSVTPIAGAPTGGRGEGFLVTLKTGEGLKLKCHDCQFFRYPDRIFSGTYYNVNLGAWYWHREDALKVETEDATVDVQLSKVGQLKVSGNYPRWDLEVHGNQTQTVLKGRLVPAQVAKQSPGISSWDSEKEGFAFWSHDRHACLFIPMKSLAEVNRERQPEAK